MPKIVEMKAEKDGHVWVRLEWPSGKESVFLWTDSEKQEALRRERDRCVRAIERLDVLSAMDQAVRDAGMSDDEPAG
jgi:hypothetical protein